MDTSEYMPMFLAETREHLQELNLAIVSLEDNPSEQQTVDQIFRIAHSLKGMSATMGFSAIAELTHVMEDVFELLRQRSGGLEAEAITTVLACLDALEGAVDAIETVGEERLNPAALIERLRRLIRGRTPDQARVRAGGAEAPAQAAINLVRAAGARVLHILVALDDEAMMPAVRAHMVLAALSEHGELIGSIPAPDEIEQFDGHVIEAWLASEHEEKIVSRAASEITDVTGVEAQELTGEVVATLPVANPSEPVPAAPQTDALQPTGADLAPTAGGSHNARTVRVDAERLDALMHLMGELVIHRTAVQAYTAEISSPELQRAVQDLTRSSQALQAMVMQVRMIPVEAVFLRFPRLVRDLQAKLSKKVELELVGRDTEMDRTVVDALGDPLVHLVRNALDHGLETPQERAAAGKPQTGSLTIAARHAGGSVLIDVRDDGRGIDPARVARKAVERGLLDTDAVDGLDTRGAIELLFTPGFSTAEVTSDISGRGVGLDAVRAKISELGGEVTMESVLGQGTRAQIRLPLTLAIVTALEIGIGGASFAIPIDRVERTLRCSDQLVRSLAGRRVLSMPDGIVPLLEGAGTFGRTSAREEDLIVIVRGNDKRIGLTVDQLVGQRELVTRPVPNLVATGAPVSGGAVLADGQIALIIDCDALAAELEDGPQPHGQDTLSSGYPQMAAA